MLADEVVVRVHGEVDFFSREVLAAAASSGTDGMQAGQEDAEGRGHAAVVFQGEGHCEQQRGIELAFSCLVTRNSPVVVGTVVVVSVVVGALEVVSLDVVDPGVVVGVVVVGVVLVVVAGDVVVGASVVVGPVPVVVVGPVVVVAASTVVVVYVVKRVAQLCLHERGSAPAVGIGSTS